MAHGKDPHLLRYEVQAKDIDKVLPEETVSGTSRSWEGNSSGVVYGAPPDESVDELTDGEIDLFVRMANPGTRHSTPDTRHLTLNPQGGP